MFNVKITEKAQAALDAVIEQFKTGDLSEVIKVARIQRKEGDERPSDKWTTANFVLAFFSTGGSLDCRGYNQWKKAGRQVKRGETAGRIFIPLFRTVEEDGQEKQKRLVGFKTQAVFGAEQTDGEPIPTFDYNPPSPPPLADVALAMGVKLTFEPLPPDRLADCSSSGKRIRMGTEEHATFWHELGHAVHARIIGGLKGGQDAAQEIIADFAACVLARMYGEDYTGNTWEYIQRYSDKPMTAIMAALGTVEEILAEIGKVQTTLA